MGPKCWRGSDRLGQEGLKELEGLPGGQAWFAGTHFPIVSRPGRGNSESPICCIPQRVGQGQDKQGSGQEGNYELGEPVTRCTQNSYSIK